MITIVKDKVAPPPRTEYPWHTMEVGDSFFVEGFTSKTFGQARNATARLKPKRWTCWNEDGGVWVQRTE